jgi:hypothetical protein
MSTYQYYEFRAVDRPLTRAEQMAVAELSSRVHPHPRRAVFTYHWSGFPTSALNILSQFYDALLFMADWGSRQLAFRFPASALDLKAVRAYCRPLCVEDYISLRVQDQYAILNMAFNPEGGHDWNDEEDWMAAMVGLRDDILHGDYRALYLVWLHVMEVEDLLDSVQEPPVPPGLRELTLELDALIGFFNIDRTLIRVAVEPSAEWEDLSKGWLQEAIDRLPQQERDAFLVRLARRETGLSAQLRRRLRQVAPLPGPVAPPRRTAGQLGEEAQMLRERERRRQLAEAEEQRIRHLRTLAEREAETWSEVFALINSKQGSAYGRAVAHLSRLRELAAYQGESAAFQERLDGIYEQFA